MRSIPAFVIAGTQSGVGKTTVCLGIMAALRQRALKVQPFKIGPDFIDPGLHAKICGVPSYNLDGWMLSWDYNRRTFWKHVQDKDVAVVEGMMGLYDGRSGATEEGSTAEMAKQLGVPVILVVDAAAMARSAAAMILGYRRFDPKIRLIGVVFNRVAGTGHLQYLKEALKSLAGLKCFGGIPTEDKVTIQERHLGLAVAQEGFLDKPFINQLGRLIEEHLELDRLLASARTKIAAPAEAPLRKPTDDKVPIAVASDQAFCFYYPDNLDLLKGAGANIKSFSPVRDRRLPEGVKGIYLGGWLSGALRKGTLAEPAATNSDQGFHRSRRSSLRRVWDLMYLTAALTDCANGEYPMVGAYPFKTRMLPRLKAFGYREVVFTNKTFVADGEKIRGHEFHYSEIDSSSGAKVIDTAYFIEGPGKTKLREGYRYKNCLASYIHLHFGSNPEFARSFVAACRGGIITRRLKHRL